MKESKEKKEERDADKREMFSSLAVQNLAS